jgi:hypothetical protein
MRSPSLRTALASCWILAGVLAAGCFASSPPSKPTSSKTTAKQVQVYSVWEFDTIAELDQMLDIKGCEGWRLAEVITRGEKIVAILVADGVAPEANPACRPSA